VLRSGDSLLVAIQIGRHSAKGGDHAIGQPAELLLKIGGSTRGSSWRRGGLLQLSHHLGMLNIRDVSRPRRRPRPPRCHSPHPHSR